MSTATTVTIGKKKEGWAITPSESALAKLAELISQEEEDVSLRVTVKSGGCSGFQYDMFFDTDNMEDDLIKEFSDVKIVVDLLSSEMLWGSSLDYEDGLNKPGFHITNPNATRTCGCGSSFS